MVNCYSAHIELERPEFVEHAINRIDSYADQHSAIARPHARAACFILTLPADDLDHAIQYARDLVKITGLRPVTFDVLTSDELDRRRPG